MSWRKRGALRYGFVALTTIVAFNQTLTPGAATLALSAPTAVLATPGVSVPIPFQRPVFQRGVFTYGPVAPSTTPDGGATSLSAGAQTLAISAPTAARVAGGVSLGAGSQTLAISAPDAARVAGGVSLSAGAQTVALSAGAATLSAPGTAGVSVPIPFQRPFFQRGIYTYGPASPSTTPETNKTLTQQAATLALSAPSATLVSAGNPSLIHAVQFRTVVKTRVARYARQPYIATFGAIDVLIPEGSTLSAGTQTLAIGAPTAARTAGAVSLTAGAQTLAISAPAPSMAQGNALAAGAQTLAISARTATLAAGTSTRAAGANTLALSAPAPAVTTTVTRTAGANTVALSAPAPTVSLATVRSAGEQTLAISAPTANRTAGAVTRSAGANVLALSAPAAIRLATITRDAGARTLAISNGAAVLTVGTSTVGSGTQTLAIIAPDPRVLGAIELPNIDESFLVSRQPTRTLASRALETFVTSRKPTRTVETTE